MKLDSTWVNSYELWAWLQNFFTCGAFYQPPPPKTPLSFKSFLLTYYYFYNSGSIATIRMILINQIKVISLIEGSQPSMLTGASVSPRQLLLKTTEVDPFRKRSQSHELFKLKVQPVIYGRVSQLLGFRQFYWKKIMLKKQFEVSQNPNIFHCSWPCLNVLFFSNKIMVTLNMNKIYE